MDPEQRQRHDAEVVDELAQRIVELEPLLRAMPDDTDNRMWLELHLRIQELGGLVPSVVVTLGHLVDGLDLR